jgi:FG-GAP repeat
MTTASNYDDGTSSWTLGKERAMDQRVRRSLARHLAVLATPLAVLGVMAGMAPASSASRLPDGPAGRTPEAAAALAPLQAAIGKSLGTAVSTAGYSQQAELTTSGGQFGQSVALSASGSTALAGSFGRNAFTGAAYVFTLHRSTWSRTAELTASDAAPGDEFGYSVTLSALGSTALAGAPFRHTSTGAAYVFTQSRGT